MRKLFIWSVLVAFPVFMVAQTPPDLKIYHEQVSNRLVIYADNNEIFPISVKLDLKYKGMKLIGELQDFYAISGNESKLQIAELEFTGRGKITFNYQYTAHMGDLVNAKHDDDFAYAIPFKSNESFKLSQGYDGDFSHQGKYSLDFTMPEGTDIVAARAGMVVQVKEDSNLGCPLNRCLEAANFVTILHDDGSFGQYVHLKKDGVLVEVGQSVEQGDIIGLSGNTGFTSGPHLHFEVTVPTDNGLTTIPTKFMVDGQKVSLENGQYYKSDTGG